MVRIKCHNCNGYTQFKDSDFSKAYDRELFLSWCQKCKKPVNPRNYPEEYNKISIKWTVNALLS